MGLRRGDADEFLLPQRDAAATLAERAHWLAADPGTYAALLPEAEPALRETVALALSLGAYIDVSQPTFDQLLSLGRCWDFDFVWMHPDASGTHRVVGGVVCFPSSWALCEKLGQTMSETHRPVPGLNQVLDQSIESFFAKMVPGVAWQRENLSFSRVPDLNQHPSRPRPRLDGTITLHEVWIRLEHQLLLKLGNSGSILFAIRVEVVPLMRLMDQPESAARLSRLLETMPLEAAHYKHVAEARGMLIAWLRSRESMG